MGTLSPRSHRDKPLYFQHPSCIQMLTCRQVVNKPIITSDGRMLGKVASATLEEDWSIPLLSILLERNVAQTFKIRRPLLGSPKAFIEPREVSALSDNVILKRGLEEMRDYLIDVGGAMEANGVLGRKVLGEEEYYFGDLQDLIIDQARWRISQLLVEVRKKAADDMGFPMTLFGTCHAKVPVKRVKAVTNSVLISLDPQGFKEYVVKERSRD